MSEETVLQEESLEESDGSDSETEIDQATHDRRKDEALRTIVQGENQFHKLKLRLRDEKLKLLERQKREVRSQTSADYLSKKRGIDEERESREKMNDSTRILSIDALERTTKGALLLAKSSYREAVRNAKDVVLATERERRDAEMQLLKTAQITQFMFEDDILSMSHALAAKRARRRTQSVEIAKRNMKELGVTVIIESITPQELDQDLRDYELWKMEDVIQRRVFGGLSQK